jgi:hypothetical protein
MENRHIDNNAASAHQTEFNKLPNSDLVSDAREKIFHPL